MKASVKYLEGTKWFPLPIADLKGHSITSFIKGTDKIVVGALLDEGKPVFFVSNNTEQVNMYKEKGLSLHIDDLLLLMGVDGVPDIALKVFPDATFESIEEVPGERIAWWNAKRE